MRKLLLDLPSARPGLDFERVARALSKIIQQSPPQFAVGLFGGWGSGKTTLMQAIERELDHDQVVPVRFSAWRYEKEQHLIVPLLDTVREGLLATVPPDQGTQARIRKTASVIGRVVRSLIAGTSVRVGVPGAIDLSIKANDALVEHRTGDDAADVPGSSYHASFRALQGAFEELVGDSSDPTVRIVVFVDDLDRCLPESAMQVLESMKLFFDLPGFVFVVGLDRDVVQHVIDSKYGTDSHGVRPLVSGTEYIKKIFQVPYRITPVTVDDLDEFLDTAARDGQLDRSQRAEISSKIRPHLRWLVGDGAVNPREIKRYINAYTLQVEISSSGELEADVVLALQTVGDRGQWMAVNNALLTYDDLFIDALERFLAGDTNALADLDPNLQSVPDDFLQYVATAAPGAALLDVASLLPYLRSSEAVRSTQNPQLLDAVRLTGKIRRQIQQGANGTVAGETVVSEVLQDLAALEAPLRYASLDPLSRAAERDTKDLRLALAGYQQEALKKGFQDAAFFGGVVSTFAADLARRVLRLYRQGDVGEQIA